VSDRADSAPGQSSGWLSIFRGARGQLTFGLLLLEFTGAIQVFTINTVLPQIAGELHGQRLYGAALAAAVLGAIMAVPVTGPLGQRWGLARILTVATPVFLVGVLASATATAMWVFILGRFIQGLAAGAMATIGLGAVAKEYPVEQRTRVMSLMSSMWIVPALVGPPYAALTTALVGWRWSLVLLVPLLLVAAGWWWRGCRRSRDRRGAGRGCRSYARCSWPPG
jgi:MFS family permease